MGLFNFGKTIKPQRFNYIPRYYDPEKEERDARIKRAMGMAGDDSEAMKTRILSDLRNRKRGSRKGHQSAARRSNLILILTLATLLLLTYILLTRYLPVIERALE